MVEAVSMHTFGLGGDSEVSLGGSASSPQIELGPRRLVPVSLVASKDPETVHEALDRQLKSVLNNRHDGRFAFRSGAGVVAGLSMVEQKLFDRLSDQPRAVEDLLEGSTDAAALQRLVGRGLAQVAGLTPSDAMHALGEHGEWDKSAAEKALALFTQCMHCV